MIAIRADANETVASGHMMRCITIARQLRKSGEEVIFFTADEYGSSMLKEAGMAYHCLHSRWDCLSEEVGVLSEELRRRGIQKLLVDSYQADREYLGRLREQSKVIYIDDMFEDVYPVNMMINYNAYHPLFPYKEVYSEDTRLLLGPSYVPLRDEFSQSDQQTEGTDEGREEFAVLLSSGGGDIHHALIGILKETADCPELSGVVFHGVVGRYHPNREELERMAADNPRILLHFDVRDMASLMGKCRAAISAAGTVLYELCAMKVPTVFFVCAENQKYDSEFFAAQGRMLYAGDLSLERKSCIDKVKTSLVELTENPELCKQMKEKLSLVTDGKGAARIAEEIISL